MHCVTYHEDFIGLTPLLYSLYVLHDGLLTHCQWKNVKVWPKGIGILNICNFSRNYWLLTKCRVYLSVTYSLLTISMKRRVFRDRDVYYPSLGLFPSPNRRSVFTLYQKQYQRWIRVTDSRSSTLLLLCVTYSIRSPVDVDTHSVPSVVMVWESLFKVLVRLSPV